MRIQSRLAPTLLSLLLVACNHPDKGGLPDGTLQYLSDNSPQTLLENLRRAWINQDAEYYSTLFADDYVFYFDPWTLQENPTLPTFWTRTDEVAEVGKLFGSDEVADIRLSLLQYEPVPEAVQEPGHESWLLIRVSDERVEIDIKPRPGDDEGVTRLVEGQRQYFYFRKGRTDSDTLASSPTSGEYYIVKWQDLGQTDDVLQISGAFTVSRSSTWSSLKTLYSK